MMQLTVQEVEARYSSDTLAEMGVYDNQNRISKKISQLKPIVQDYEDSQLCRCQPDQLPTCKCDKATVFELKQYYCR